MPAIMGDGGFENIADSVEGAESNRLVKAELQAQSNDLVAVP